VRFVRAAMNTMVDNKPKICVTCKHCYDGTLGYIFCKSPHLGIDIVTGLNRSVFARNERGNGACGVIGIYWEPVSE
jgi:hypothetical protein